jgi:hypothetical protein
MLKVLLLFSNAVAVEVIATENTSDVSGQFVWSGELPTRKLLEKSDRVSDQSWVFSSSAPVLRGWNVDRNSRGIKDICVYLTNKDGTDFRVRGKTSFTKAEQFQVDFLNRNGYELDQLPSRMVGCELPQGGVQTDAVLIMCYKGRFIPECVALHEGQAVVFVNCDKIGYYLNCDRNGQSERFSLRPGATRICLWQAGKRFDVHCSIHPWMRLSLTVFSHPYYALTDNAGKFALGQIPAGSYSLIAQHYETFVNVVDNSSARCCEQGKGWSVTVTENLPVEIGPVKVSCAE